MGLAKQIKEQLKETVPSSTCGLLEQGEPRQLNWHLFIHQALFTLILCLCHDGCSSARTRARVLVHTPTHTPRSLSLSAGMGIVFLIDVPHSSDVVPWLSH